MTIDNFDIRKINETNCSYWIMHFESERDEIQKQINMNLVNNKIDEELEKKYLNIVNILVELCDYKAHHNCLDGLEGYCLNII